VVPLEVAVLGAGVAGLSSALALARDGHRVTLVERDELVLGDPSAALSWRRQGIPHFLQPHAFIPRGRRELRQSFPDVYQALLNAGARDLDLRPKLPGRTQPADEELAYLGVRRPLIEWALRRAVMAVPSVRTLSGARALGLAAEPGDVPRIRGVATTAGTLEADLVVDAMGRRSPVPAWIAALGGTPLPERSSECGIIYYCRYYRVRAGASLRDGPWVPGPRADLGYGAFSTFPGDNGTFAAVIAIPPGDQELKALRNAAAYDAAAATMPALHAWTNADTATPITDVLPMGSLQNVLRMPDSTRPPARSLVSVGDAICHTDPALALGLSFGLIHARALAHALRDHAPDVDGAALAFYDAVRPEMEERFGLSSAIDAARARRWAGEPVDIAHRDGGAYPLFTLLAGSAAATVDPDVFRVVVRRNTFLDPLSILDEDLAMQERIERIFGRLSAERRPPPGPARNDLLAAILAAVKAAHDDAASPIASS
jgi:2-polyprenyl-6-methoxyphenol hydroxylase-like FAD-dependent oxidoreductase